MTLEIAKHERWEQSNRLSLMFMKSHVIKGIQGSIPECIKAKDFIKVVEEQFVSSDKALASTLMKRLSSKTFDNSRSVREHIMEMRDMSAQLKSIEVDVSKKENIISLVCHESFFIEAPCNTWWIDSGSTIHFVNTMQGFLNTRKPTSHEQQVYSGNKLFSQVEAVGTFRLILKSGYVLDLDNVFFIPHFSRNLISVSKLDIIGYGFWFINSTFSIF